MLASLAWSLSKLKITFNLCRGVRGYDFHHFIFYGDDLMRIKIALALMSAIFMMVWIAILLGYIFLSSPLQLIRRPILVIELLSIISFLSSVLFLVEARKVLPRWYLAVPLCVSLFALVIVNFWIYFDVEKFPFSDPTSTAEIYWIILTALLSPFSGLVFLSLNGHPDSMNVYLAISCVASIFSMFSLFLILQEILKWYSYEPLLFFPYVYWVIVMPIIGVCFLVRAITYKNPGNVLTSVTVGFTQN